MSTLFLLVAEARRRRRRKTDVRRKGRRPLPTLTRRPTLTQSLSTTRHSEPRSCRKMLPLLLCQRAYLTATPRSKTGRTSVAPALTCLAMADNAGNSPSIQARYVNESLLFSLSLHCLIVVSYFSLTLLLSSSSSCSSPQKKKKKQHGKSNSKGQRHATTKTAPSDIDMELLNNTALGTEVLTKESTMETLNNGIPDGMLRRRRRQRSRHRMPLWLPSHSLLDTAATLLLPLPRLPQQVATGLVGRTRRHTAEQSCHCSRPRHKKFSIFRLILISFASH